MKVNILNILDSILLYIQIKTVFLHLMRGMKNIYITCLALIIVISTNGFFVEKYLCGGCQKQHSEVILFEFGEISHNHPHCNNCEGKEHACSCHNEEHLKHSKISYFSLDQLFFGDTRTDAPSKITIDIPKFLSTDYSHSNGLNYFSNAINKTLKLPPLIDSIVSSANPCAVLSVFIL
jgi:hypothetical protein